MQAVTSLRDMLDKDYNVCTCAVSDNSMALNVSGASVWLYSDRAVVMPGHLIILFSEPDYYRKLCEAIKPRAKDNA